MKTIEKYIVTEDERRALLETFVPLAFLINDDERARKHINRIVGNQLEYSKEQRQELIDAVRDVAIEARKQATLEHWRDMMYADLLVKMRDNEAVRLSALVALLSGDE